MESAALLPWGESAAKRCGAPQGKPNGVAHAPAVEAELTVSFLSPGKFVRRDGTAPGAHDTTYLIVL